MTTGHVADHWRGWQKLLPVKLTDESGHLWAFHSKDVTRVIAIWAFTAIILQVSHPDNPPFLPVAQAHFHFELWN